MSSKEDKLLAAKTKLCLALGESSTKTYMANLKMWFRKVWTKEQFDLECRKLFTLDQRHLHNEFFLAILNKIMLPLHKEMGQSSNNISVHSDHSIAMQGAAKSSSTTSTGGSGSGGGGGSGSGKKCKRNSRATSERRIFRPVEIYDYLSDDDPDLQPPSTPLPLPRFAAKELFLPDNGLILGRLLIAAWENGLANADEDICDLVVIAVQNVLKNILTAILKARKNYRVTGGSGFFYDVGCPLKDPFIKNTVTRQIIDDHPFEVDTEIWSMDTQQQINEDSTFLAGCENLHENGTLNGRITVLDLYMALQDRNVIPCHSVYAINIERISQRLN